MPDEKLILLRTFHEHGKERQYPANDTAKLWCKIAGVQVFDQRMIDLASTEGFTVDFVDEPYHSHP